jgi:hypothetical protein
MKRFVLLSFILIASGLFMSARGQSGRLAWTSVIRQQIRYSHCDSCGSMIHSIVRVTYTGDHTWELNFPLAFQQLTFESYFDTDDATVTRRGDTVIFNNPAYRYYTHFLPCQELLLDDVILVQHQHGYLILQKNSGKVMLHKTFATSEARYQLSAVDIRETGSDTSAVLSAGLSRFVAATIHYLFIFNGREVLVIDRKRLKEIHRIRVKFARESAFKLAFSAKKKNFALSITGSLPRD